MSKDFTYFNFIFRNFRRPWRRDCEAVLPSMSGHLHSKDDSPPATWWCVLRYWIPFNASPQHARTEAGGSFPEVRTKIVWVQDPPPGDESTQSGGQTGSCAKTRFRLLVPRRFHKYNVQCVKNNNEQQGQRQALRTYS